MERQTDRWRNRQTDEKTDSWREDRQRKRQEDRWKDTDRKLFREMKRQTDRWRYKQTLSSSFVHPQQKQTNRNSNGRTVKINGLNKQFINHPQFCHWPLFFSDFLQFSWQIDNLPPFFEQNQRHIVTVTHSIKALLRQRNKKAKHFKCSTKLMSLA